MAGTKRVTKTDRIYALFVNADYGQVWTHQDLGAELGFAFTTDGPYKAARKRLMADHKGTCESLPGGKVRRVPPDETPRVAGQRRKRAIGNIRAETDIWASPELERIPEAFRAEMASRFEQQRIITVNLRLRMEQAEARLGEHDAILAHQADEIERLREVVTKIAPGLQTLLQAWGCAPEKPEKDQGMSGTSLAA